MELGALKTLIQPVLDARKLRLMDLKWVQDGHTRILQIQIMYPDGTMDVDTCGDVSTAVSELLDQSPMAQSEYYLEVCSPGAERPLTTDEDLHLAVDGYVHLVLLHPLEKSLEHEGKLLAYDGHQLTVEIMLKSRKKVITVAKENLVKARLAVKL
jgi:ribosome maturation factor RimP